MSDYVTAVNAQPVENVGRGTLFALAAIPVSIIASALLGSLLGIASGLVALAVAYFAGWLYSKGAGGPFDGKPVGPAGRMSYILIAVAAVVLGALTSVVAATFVAFSRVNPRDGILSGTFATTLGRQFTNGELIFPLVLCLALGAVGIAGVLRGPRNATITPAQQAAGYPAQPGMPVQPPVYPNPADQTAAPSIPVTPPVTPPNQSSPGIILNGKPIDPSKQ